jgi:hypothetical protein|nr:MAG TPA: hypothetical protein [Caudoviricetes sp.]DAW70891.1 MAG TPA: hypothetical protein [Caudoviricetes sp.]
MSQTDIVLYRGDDEERRVRIYEKQPDGELKPYDLTNIKRLDLWAKVRSHTVISLSSTDETIKVVDAENGVILLKFHHDLTKYAIWSEANYDLQTISNTGAVKTVIRNALFKLEGDVTPQPNEDDV